jgi:uncharacterized protein with LGFP repeats
MEPCIAAINAKYTALGGTASPLGSATTAVKGYFATSGAVHCYRTFTGGSIEWSAATGAHEVHGDIGRKWASLGYDMSFLALPTTDELVAANGGRYNDFQSGAIYWHPTLGAYAMHAEIHAKYKAVGGAGSRLGYPTNDTTVLDYNPGMFNHFQGGSIYSSAATGARAVHGPTRDRWAADGWERGYLGYPASDTQDGLVRGGSFTHFQGWDRRHSIYSSSAGTRVVSGRIREKWARAAGMPRVQLRARGEEHLPGGLHLLEPGERGPRRAEGHRAADGGARWALGVPRLPRDELGRGHGHGALRGRHAVLAPGLGQRDGRLHLWRLGRWRGRHDAGVRRRLAGLLCGQHLLRADGLRVRHVPAALHVHHPLGVLRGQLLRRLLRAVR